MSDSPLMDDITIYQEMLTHPPLFSHNNPEKTILVGDTNCRLLTEVLKHHTISEVWDVTEYLCPTAPTDPKITYHAQLPILPTGYFDVMIMTEPPKENNFADYFESLQSGGIFLQLSDSPFNVPLLRDIQINLQLAGFRDIHIVSFPQPNFTTGWRAALMAKKNGIFTRVREKAIFNKSFATRFYNLDVHKAALVLPEFIREALTI